MSDNSDMQPLLKNDPQIVGQWRLLGRLGSGGMGVVYYGVDFKKSSSNEVALKIIREHILEEPSARARLEREIDSLHAIDSPYVAKIVDSEIDSSPAWIATQRINGPSLSKWIEENGPVNYQQWLNLAYGMLHAIHAIHHAGIIHRDVKPSNILLEQQGEILVPKLIDFGIAVDQDSTSITRTGVLVGTPAWLAPEQFSGDIITQSVDMFAIGATLLFAATGRNPWGIQDTTPIGVVIGTITSGTPNLDGINREQRQLLGSLLQKKQAKRLDSSAAIKLVEQLAAESGQALLQLGKSTSILDNLVPKPKRERFAIGRTAWVIGGLLSLISIAGLLIFQSSPTKANIVIRLTSVYLNDACVGISGLQGIENSKVFVKSEGESSPVFVGRLENGIHAEENTCTFEFLVNSFRPDITEYQLQVNFPWENYFESFEFTGVDSKNPLYELNLKLD
jgi:serine/threonine protein kinase